MSMHGLSLQDALNQLASDGRPTPVVREVIKLRGDASTRSYYRLRVEDGGATRSLIVMKLPADALKSDEGTSGAAPTELPFLNMQRLLRARGVPVPEMFAVDMKAGVLLLEDLGDATFFERLQRTPPDQWRAHYEAAIDCLADMHKAMAEPAAGCLAYGRSFDAALLRWELDHFVEWGVEALRGPLSPALKRELDPAFDALVAQLTAMPQGFVHRDYQSKNLMWVPRGGRDQLVVIDFQDALQGPRVYDLVALLCDSYVDLDEALQTALVHRYAARMEMSASDTASLLRELWRVALQRKLKDAGRFIYIDRVRNNPDFLQWFPQSLRYVGRALSHCDDMKVLQARLPELVDGFPDHAPVPASIHAK